MAWEQAGRNRGLDLEPRRVDADAHGDENGRHDNFIQVHTIEACEKRNTSETVRIKVEDMWAGK